MLRKPIVHKYREGKAPAVAGGELETGRMNRAFPP